MATGGYDKVLCVWDLRTMTQRLQITDCKGYVFSCAFAQDDNYAVVGVGNPDYRV